MVPTIPSSKCERGGGRWWSRPINCEGERQRATYLREFPQEIFAIHLDVLRQIPQHNHLQRLKGSNSNATEGILELFGFLFILGFSPGIIPFKEDVECLDEDTLVLLGNIGELALQLMLLEEGVVCILLKPFDEFLLGYFLQFSTVPWSFPLAPVSLHLLRRGSADLNQLPRKSKEITIS